MAIGTALMVAAMWVAALTEQTPKGFNGRTPEITLHEIGPQRRVLQITQRLWNAPVNPSTAIRALWKALQSPW